MALIHPFNAWRSHPNKVNKIASVPYDVVSTEEARVRAEGNPHSFLHVIRPEIDLPEGTPFDDDAVYRQGADNLERMQESGDLVRDGDEAVYLYRLSSSGHSQTGIFTCVSVDDYDNEVILKHELTRPKKEDDRTRHILTQQAHAEPVILTFKDSEGVAGHIEQQTVESEPLYDFTDDDGVRHTLWKVTDTDPFERLFSRIPKLYIADGHHRCKSASRAAAVKREETNQPTGNEEYEFFPAVLFPVDQMRILAYNRVIFDVPAGFLKTLDNRHTLEAGADPRPPEKGRVSIYRGGEWFGLELPEAENPNSVESLDVYRLHEFILKPLLDISDPRTDSNIDFVGGIRGTEALEEQIDSGNADLAISMYPTNIEELIAVSDEGLLMPPKSTWFEPKLRSGLIVHTF